MFSVLNWGMKINDAVHALILFDQKKLIPRRTLLISATGINFKFIRMDTQLNWPRVIVEDEHGEELVLNSKNVALNAFTAREPEIKVEAFIDPA